jgi:hypothetical protein
MNLGISTDTFPLRVTVAYIPDGRSEPVEDTVYAAPGEDIDSLVQRAIDGRWDAGDEPFEVRSAAGRALWQSSRW